MSFLIIFLFAAIIAREVTAETGLFRHLPELQTCLQRYTCITTASGATQIGIVGDGEWLEFRHSEYATGADRDESILNGAIRAGNLSTFECYSEQIGNSTCFNTSITVFLNQRTECEVLQCWTVFSSTENIFGNATLARKPPTPANLRADFNQSLEVEFSWYPEGNNCTPYVHYRISTMNCGSCPLTMNISQSFFSCGDLLPGQNCSVSVQVVEQCATSDAATLSIEVPSVTVPSVTDPSVPEASVDLTIIIIGAVVGSVGFLIVVIIIINICCAAVYACHRCNSTKVKRKNTVFEPINASRVDDDTELVHSRSCDVSLAKGPIDGVDAGTSNPLFGAFNEQKEITDGTGSENPSIALSLRSSKEPSRTVGLSPNGSSPHPGTPAGLVDYGERLSKLEDEQKQQREEFSAKFDEQSVKIEDQRKHFQTKVLELTRQIETLTARYNDLLRKSDKERKEHQAEKEQLEHQIRVLKQELSAAKTSLEKLRKNAAKNARPGSKTL